MHLHSREFYCSATILVLNYKQFAFSEGVFLEEVVLRTWF